MRVILTLMALLLSTSQALASGLNVPVIGTSESGPTHADPASVFWNPALLVNVGNESLFVGSLLVLDLAFTRQRLGRYQHSDGLRFNTPIDEADIDASRTGVAKEARATAALPSGAFFGAWKLNDDLALGLGLFAPFGALLDFGKGPQEWAVRDVTLVVFEVAPAISWRMGSGFSVGGGVSLVAGMLKMRKTVDLAATDLLSNTFSNPPIGQDNSFGTNAPSDVRELDVLSRDAIIGPAFALSFAARLGLAWEYESVRVGASYTYRGPMTFVGTFNLDLDDPFFTEDLASQGLKYAGPVSGAVEVDFPLPSQLNAGFSWAGDSLVLSTAFTWMQYSIVKALDARLASNELVQPELNLGSKTGIAIPRNWKDTYHFDLRAMWDFKGWRLGGLGGFQTGVSPDSTLDVASPDGDRAVGALMGGWSIGKVEWLGARSVEMVGDLRVEWVMERENKGSDYDLANGVYRLLVGSGTVGARVLW